MRMKIKQTILVQNMRKWNTHTLNRNGFYACAPSNVYFKPQMFTLPADAAILTHGSARYGYHKTPWFRLALEKCVHLLVQWSNLGLCLRYSIICASLLFHHFLLSNHCSIVIQSLFSRYSVAAQPLPIRYPVSK